MSPLHMQPHPTSPNPRRFPLHPAVGDVATPAAGLVDPVPAAVPLAHAPDAELAAPAAGLPVHDAGDPDDSLLLSDSSESSSSDNEPGPPPLREDPQLLPGSAHTYQSVATLCSFFALRASFAVGHFTPPPMPTFQGPCTNCVAYSRKGQKWPTRSIWKRSA